MKTYLFFFVIVALFSSCTESFRFAQPQPRNARNHSHFPAYLQASFQDTDHNEKLRFTAQRVIHFYIVDVEIPVGKLDSAGAERVAPDSLFFKKDSIVVFVEEKNDSLMGRYTTSDTLFSISESGILRKKNKCWWLSLSNEDGSWNVMRLVYSKKEGKIEISRIPANTPQEELEKYTPVLQVEKGEAASKKMIDPSRRELRKIVKAGLFEVNREFYKLE